MATHVLEPDTFTVHGKVSRDLPPVLEIEPGDTVVFHTLDAGWGLEPHGPNGEPPRRLTPRPDLGGGHALCGPVLVRGAEPGMTLEIEIGELRPGAWGWNFAGGWSSPMNDRLGVAGTRSWLSWALDPAAGTATDGKGRRVAMRPFMGWMGVAPAEPGWHSTTPPRRVGGNIDCKELVSGSTLFLPIEVAGALFSTGDGHAAQGDGEVSGIAIECPVERLELTFRLREDTPLERPRAETPAGQVTFGFDRDLNEASAQALSDMLDLMGETLSLEREEALALASVVVDLRVTQVVNDVWGVHAVLPEGAISQD